MVQSRRQRGALWARSRPGAAGLGDQPDLLGVAIDSAAGVSDWLDADVGVDSLAGLSVPVGERLDLLPFGGGSDIIVRWWRTNSS